MLYKLVRPLAILALKTNFRKIYFSHAERIPWGKPVILAVNHPTSFIEPCMLAAYLPRPLHFLARGNLFKKPFYGKVLKSLHILPVFRLKDGGYGQIKNNYTTLARCFDALKDKKTILIMAEGGCTQEKRLRPMRKGTARLAFGTYEKYGNLDVQIVPVGVNYTYPDEFRSEAMFDFGEPIAVSDYLELYDKNPNEAFKELTEELRSRLQKRIVIIEKEEDELLTENLLVAHRTDNQDELLPFLSEDPERLSQEVGIAQRVNEMNAEEKKSMLELTERYFYEIRTLGISDEGVQRSNFADSSNLVVLLTGFIPFLIGYFGNWLPMRYAQHIMDSRVKDVEDRMSVGIAVAIGGFIIYYILLFSAALIINKLWVWILLIVLPIWGFFSLMYKEFYGKYKIAKKVQALGDPVLQDLKQARKKMLENFKFKSV